MKIDFTCPNCQRTLRVASKHIGKKAKCPSCETISVIEESPAHESPAQGLPTAQQIPQPAQPSSTSLFDSEFDSGSDPFGSSNPRANTNPYQALSAKGQPFDPGPSQSDVPGILSVIFGGLSFLCLMLCFCFGPFGLISIVAAIAGFILSFYARPPLKIIGIILNSLVLVICIFVFIAAIVLWIMAVNGAFDAAIIY